MSFRIFMLSLFTALNIYGSTQGSGIHSDDLVRVKCSLRHIERRSGSVIHANNASTSVNWSGYAAITGTANDPDPTYGSVKDVSGTWIVPSLVSNPEGDTFSSAWVGIDGYVSPVVEQIGTEHDVIGGVPTYYAWFSLYPAPTQIIDGFPVNPGDKIEAKVSYQGQDTCGNDVFRLSIKNRTQKVVFNTTQHTLPGYPAHLSSAEWIVEAPGIVDQRIPCLNLAFLPLANFTSIPFGNCKTTIDGKSGGIKNKHWTFDAISMVTGKITKAIPTPLNIGCINYASEPKECKGDCFKVNWENPGPFPYEVYCPPIVP